MTIFRFETWKIVPSLPTVMVSSEGRVMVVPYRAEMPNGGLRPEGGEPHFGTWDSKSRRFNFNYKRKTYRLNNSRMINLAKHSTASQKPFASTVACTSIDGQTSANNRPSINAKPDSVGDTKGKSERHWFP